MAQQSDNKGILRSLDWVTIILYICLLVLGWVSVCGASYDFDQAGNVLDFSTRSGMQIVWIGTSLVLGAIILSVDERVYEAFSYLLYAGFLVLLAVTPFLARDIKGSLSWIKIGTFSVQPAEFAKFATALCVARFISGMELHLGRLRDLILAALVILVPMALIVLQKETGSALVYFAFFLMFYREGMSGAFLFVGVSAVYYFVVGIRFADSPLFNLPEVSLGRFLVFLAIWLFTAGMTRVYVERRTPFRWIFYGGLATTLLSFLFSEYVIPFDITWVQLGLLVLMVGYLIYWALRDRLMQYVYIAVFAIGSLGFFYSTNYVLDNVMEPHQQTRIRVLLGIEDDPRGAGYNVIQAQIAIGSGGLKGKGFLNGTQTKLKYVPEQDTDFIFCTVGEEEGFVGSSVVLLLFLALILRLIHLAERQVYRFGRVYGYCVMGVFLFHVFINVGMVLGLTPVIGIPLPFFSYGGSSLWGFTLLLFIFLRIDAARNKLIRQT